MSLRSKIALVLFFAVSLFVGGDYILSQLTFKQRAFEFDSARAKDHIGRVLTAFEGKLEDLDRAAFDLEQHLGDPAHWEDGIDYPVSAAGESLHVIVAFDEDGWVKAHRIVDPHTGEPLLLRSLPNQKLNPSHPFVCQSTGQTGDCDEWTGRHGILTTERATLLISMREIENSDPPVRIAVGRFLDEDFVSNLQKASGLEVDVILANAGMLPENQQQILALAASTNDPIVQEDGGHLHAWAAVHDLRENTAILLRIDAPSNLSHLWTAMSRDSLVSTVAVAILFPFVIMVLLQLIVTGPLSRLTSHVINIARSNESGVRLDMERADEIGQLANEFDDMLGKLEQSRQEVVSNARLAGMSELSAGVLHNVGNVLNSVSVSANLAQSHIKEISQSDLQAILNGLEENSSDLATYLTEDDRGKHLLRFLTGLVRQHGEKTQSVASELESLDEGIAQMANLISSLQDYDARISVVEPIDLVAQLDAAIELSMRSLDHETSIKVIREYEDLPRVRADRHKLMEILVNLVLNAVQAMEAAGNSSNELTVRVARQDEETARVEVSDNGTGIPDELLAIIFSQGFSTREDGRGLGLHLSGTAAVEMGAKLTASSDGPGCGATFTLCVPFAVAEANKQEATTLSA